MQLGDGGGGMGERKMDKVPRAGGQHGNEGAKETESDRGASGGGDHVGGRAAPGPPQEVAARKDPGDRQTGNPGL